MNLVKISCPCNPSDIDELLKPISSMDLKSIVAGVIWYDNFGNYSYENRVPYFDKYLAHPLSDGIQDRDIVEAFCMVGFQRDIAERRMNMDVTDETMVDEFQFVETFSQIDFNFEMEVASA